MTVVAVYWFRMILTISVNCRLHSNIRSKAVVSICFTSQRTTYLTSTSRSFKKAYKLYEPHCLTIHEYLCREISKCLHTLFAPISHIHIDIRCSDLGDVHNLTEGLRCAQDIHEHISNSRSLAKRLVLQYFFYFFFDLSQT